VIDWTNLGINAVAWACCFLATWGVSVLVKGDGRLWVAGLCPPICMGIGCMAAVIWPFVKM
jgi:hypothetical protein